MAMQALDRALDFYELDEFLADEERDVRAFVDQEAVYTYEGSNEITSLAAFV